MRTHRARQLAVRSISRGAVLAALVGLTVLGSVVVPSSSAQAAPTPLSNPILQAIAGTPSSVATTSVPGCDGSVTPPACPGPVTMNYGAGTQYRLTGYTVGGQDFQVLPVGPGEAYVEVFRVNNAAVTGQRSIIFGARTSQATPYNTVVSNDPIDADVGDIFGNDIITEGSDNTFANAGTLNINNIERISFLREQALITSDPTRVGLTLLERGGNDPFRLAAVTAVDADGNPTAWGSILNVPASAWGTGAAGTVLANTPSTVLRRDPGDAQYRPTTTTPPQKLAGMYISLADLGVAAGQQIFGVSMIPLDQPSFGGPFTSLTTDGNANGGIDLIGGVFVSAVPPTAAPTTGTDLQGRAQQLQLAYAPGDAIAPIDTTRTRLTAPPGGTVNGDGTLVTVPGEGTYTLDRPSGIVTFQPLPAFVGTATPIGYEVTDVQGGTANSTITPTVTPVAQPDTTTGLQGVAQTAPVLANDGAPGVTLDPATLVLLDAAGNPVPTLIVAGEGSYAVAPGGQIIFTPEPDFVGTATPIRYQVDDTEGNTVETLYTPSVTAVTPTAAPDTSTGPQGVPQSVDPLLNDAPGDPTVPLDPASLTLLDAGGNPVPTVVVPGQGSYAINAGRIVFTPEPGFIGTATPVGYRIADVNGTTATSSYTPVVAGVAPSARPDFSTGAQGVTQQVDPLLNDVPGDPAVPLDPASLTLLDGAGNPTTIVNVPGEGSYSLLGGVIVFTPDPAFTGTGVGVAYRVADVNGTPTESIYVPSVIPIAFPDTTDGPQGIAQSVDPLLNDDPGGLAGLQPETLTLLDGLGNPTADPVIVPGQGTYSLDDGIITFTPEPDFIGTPAPVRYQVLDAGDNAVESVYVPSFDPVIPVAAPDFSTGIQGVPQSVDPLVNDDEGDPLVPLDPASLTLLDAAGNPTDAPVVIDGQGTYAIVDGRIVFTPLPTFVGTATSIGYEVADINGTSTSSTYTPTVVAVTPVAVEDVSTGPQGLPQSVDPLLNDTPGDPLVPLVPTSLTLLDAEGNPTDAPVVIDGQGTYAIVDGRIVFTPLPTFVGTATSIGYEVADINGTITSSTYTPTVVAVTPVAVEDVSTGPQGLPQSVDPLLNDVPGDPLVPLDSASLTLLDAEGNPTDAPVVIDGQGTYAIVDGRIVFTPLPTFVGPATPVGYQVADVNGTTAEAIYTPTVVAVTPVAVEDVSTGPQGLPQSVDPLLNDVPGDPLVPLDSASLTLLDAEGNPTDEPVVVDGQGTYTLVGGRIVFTPLPTFVGPATPVGYQVADVNGTVAASTYSPTVDPLTPVATPDTSSGLQRQPQSVDPLLNDRPGDPAVGLDPATLTLLDAAGNPTDQPVVIEGQGTYTLVDGRIVFTPLPEFTGAATPVSYRVSDVNGTPATSTYTPVVLIDAVPIDVGTIYAANTGVVGQPVTVDLRSVIPGLLPDSVQLLDPQGNPTRELAVPGQGVWTVDPATGAVTFTPYAGFTGNPTPVAFTALTVEGRVITGRVAVRYQQPAGPASPPLASTGFEPWPFLSIGGGLLALGAVALLMGRRRRS